MGRKKTHTPEEIVAKLRQVEVLAAQGKAVAEAVRSIGVTEQTYHRWRNEFGGLKLDQVKRLKELEAENQRRNFREFRVRAPTVRIEGDPDGTTQRADHSRPSAGSASGRG